MTITFDIFIDRFIVQRLVSRAVYKREYIEYIVYMYDILARARANLYNFKIIINVNT